MNKTSLPLTQNQVSRRDFLRLAGITGGVIALSACAAPPAAPAQGGQQAAAGSGNQPASAAQVSLSWWNPYSTASTQEALPPIIESFEKLYPNVKIEWQNGAGGPPGGGNYVEVLLSRIASGNPPDMATLFTGPSQFGARGSLTAIDDFMSNAKKAKADAFYAGPLKSCQWQGKTYGLPSSAGAGAIYINTAKFKEKGVSTKREDFPKKWDELLALSAEFDVWEGEDLKQIGLAPWTGSWLKAAWSGLNGGTLYNVDANKYEIDSESNIEWLNFWVDWLEKQYKGDIEKMNVAGNWGGTYPDSQFSMGNAAMAMEGSWSTTDAEIPFEFEVAKFAVGPHGNTSVTGFWPNWWVVPKGSAHPAEAFNLVEYFSTDGWVIWYKYIMDTPAWKDFPADVLTKKLVDSVGQERALDFHKFFADYLENTVPMWTSPVEDFASDNLDSTIDEVLHKAKPPAQALQEAQKLISSKLEDALKGS